MTVMLDAKATRRHEKHEEHDENLEMTPKIGLEHLARLKDECESVRRPSSTARKGDFKLKWADSQLANVMLITRKQGSLGRGIRCDLRLHGVRQDGDHGWRPRHPCCVATSRCVRDRVRETRGAVCEVAFLDRMHRTALL